MNPTSKLIQHLASVEDSRVVGLAGDFLRLYATYQNKDKILHYKLLEMRVVQTRISYLQSGLVLFPFHFPMRILRPTLHGKKQLHLAYGTSPVTKKEKKTVWEGKGNVFYELTRMNSEHHLLVLMHFMKLHPERQCEGRKKGRKEGRA